MTDEPVPAESTARTATRTEGVDARWLTLQRTVAVGMLVVLISPMLVVLNRLVPPLAIASVLFAVALALTWFRPRAGALGVGVLATSWLLLQLANLSMVAPDLTRPSATLSFLVTLGMLAFGVAGLVGLAGVVRRAPGGFAIRTIQGVAAVLLGGLALGLLAGL